ncbi:MAG: hypothetical protein GX228_07290 [Firmicutes bacterium]|jgi:hypothetical protein|nr:BofC C-terminal domain-containing protein [Bacillota bacterium]NLL88716.1 hypothetical protein [Bacillota bacterium]
MGRGWVVFFVGLLCFAISYIISVRFVERFELFPQIPPPGRSASGIDSDLAEPDSQLIENEVRLLDETGKPSSEGQESIQAAKQLYIGIHDQHVAIFQGKPGLGGILVEKTEIPIAKLPEFEIRNLRLGIPFTDESQKYSILDGLHFPL